MINVNEAQFVGASTVTLDPGVARPIAGRAFSAKLSRLTTGTATADLVALDPHRYESTSTTRTRRRALLMVAVAAGRLQGTAGETPFEVLPGQALLLDTRHPLQSTVEEPVRLIRTLIDQHHLAAPSQVPAPAVVLDDRPILQSCIAAATALIHRTRSASSGIDETAVSALLTGLHLALLAERDHDRPTSQYLDVTLDRRHRIEHLIDIHHHDPRFDPAWIGEALQISLRTVHAAFVGSGTTCAARIRQRRINTAQTLLRERRVLPSLKELAMLCGFADTESLRRSFTTITGSTIRDYFDKAHQQPIPTPPVLVDHRIESASVSAACHRDPPGPRRADRGLGSRPGPV